MTTFWENLLIQLTICSLLYQSFFSFSVSVLGWEFDSDCINNYLSSFVFTFTVSLKRIRNLESKKGPEIVAIKFKVAT